VAFARHLSFTAHTTGETNQRGELYRKSRASVNKRLSGEASDLLPVHDDGYQLGADEANPLWSRNNSHVTLRV